MTLLVRDASKLPKLSQPVIVTVGNFDGLHKGHQSILSSVTELAGSHATKVLLSFYPHPAFVLGKRSDNRRICSLRQNIRLLEQYGIDIFYLRHFTQAFSELTPYDFCKTLLIDEIGASIVVVGEDARVGANREGTPEVLQEILSEFACTLKVLDFVKTSESSKVSSRKVIECIQKAELDQVHKLLGRRFVVDGRVRHGDKRGKSIGYPTANLVVADQFVPKYGIYATRVLLDGRWYKGATNVGISPTFKGSQERIETYFVDYSGEDFYGSRIEVEFHKFIRPEKSFDNIESLKDQIARDVQEIEKLLDQ